MSAESYEQRGSFLLLATFPITLVFDAPQISLHLRLNALRLKT